MREFPKASTIRLRNSPDHIDFLLKIIKLLSMNIVPPPFWLRVFGFSSLFTTKKQEPFRTPVVGIIKAQYRFFRLLLIEIPIPPDIVYNL